MTSFEEVRNFLNKLREFLLHWESTLKMRNFSRFRWQERPRFVCRHLNYKESKVLFVLRIRIEYNL